MKERSIFLKKIEMIKSHQEFSEIIKNERYIKNKNFPGASSLFITVLSIIALRFLNQDSCFYFIWLILICLILAICLFVLIKNIKTRQSEGFYYMPFGPALVFAAFLVFFYSDKILSFLS